MAAAQCISRLGAWEGYEVESDEEVCRAGAVWCVIRLKPMTQVLRCCSGCGEWVESVHDLQTRHVRDLPIFETPVELVVPRVRLLCPRCGPKLEHLSWLEPYSRSTVRLEKSAARLCKVMSVRHVASFYGLAWTAVNASTNATCSASWAPSIWTAFVSSRWTNSPSTRAIATRRSSLSPCWE